MIRSFVKSHGLPRRVTTTAARPPSCVAGSLRLRGEQIHCAGFGKSHLGSWPSVSVRTLATAPQPEKKAAREHPEPAPPVRTRKPKVDLKPGPTKSSHASHSPKKEKERDASTTAPPKQTGSAPHPLTPASPLESQSIKEATLRDIADAERHGLIQPAPKDAQWYVKLAHTAKELFKFYWRGLKQIKYDRDSAKKILRRVKHGGDPLTRWEWRFIRVNKQDQLKLIPFLLVVCTIEELIPLMVMYAPFLLPSTCLLPSQRERIEKNKETKQIYHRERFFVVYKLLAAEGGLSKSISLAGGAADAQSTEALCGLMQISTRFGSAMRKRRLIKRLALVIEDDKHLLAEGLESLSHRELLDALHERGVITAGLSKEMVRPRLQYWLDAVKDATDVSHEDAVARRLYLVAESGATSPRQYS